MSGLFRAEVNAMTLPASWIPPEGAIYHQSGFYTQTVVHGDLSVGRVIQPRRRLTRDQSHTTDTFGITDAVLCIVHLRHMNPGHTFWDGHHLPTSEMFEGSIHLHDQRYSWTSELFDAFDSVHFSFPQRLLRQVLMEDDIDSHVEITAATYDPERRDHTMLNLARALLPALARPTEISRLFADHVISAAATHIAGAYGSIHLKGRRPHVLTQWQANRVTEYVTANLACDISINDLAAICRLSPGHFAHAFSTTMGMPPHRYVLGRRIARSLEMMVLTELSLSEIALGCGFADQSHYSRVFRSRIGVSPGKWRRIQKG